MCPGCAAKVYIEPGTVVTSDLLFYCKKCQVSMEKWVYADFSTCDECRENMPVAKVDDSCYTYLCKPCYSICVHH